MTTPPRPGRAPGIAPALAGILAASSAAALAFGVSSNAAFAADAEPSPLDVYRKFGDDRDPKIRRKAVLQLAGARGAEVVAALLEAADDDDDKVRAAALEVLTHDARDRDEEVEALVKRGLRKGPERVHRAAVAGLAVAGKPAGDALVAALDDRYPAVRCDVLAALGELGDAALAPRVAESLLDKESGVRAEAISVLGMLQGADAAGAAAGVLRGDSSATPRVAAAIVLGRAQCADTALHLAYGVRDPDWSVRVASAGSASALRTDTAAARAVVPALVAALGHEERARVRGAFADALHELTGIDFGPEHARWAAWLAEEGATFEPPQRPAKKRRHADASGSTAAHLLDLPIDSDHVVFVVDCSHRPIRLTSGRTV